MAVKAAVANGNLTTGSTWATVDSTSYSNSESANTAVTTSVVASSTFTPGAITVDGVAVKIASRAASPTGTFTIELFNSTGSASVDSVTVNVSDVPTATATSGSTTPVGTAEGGWFFVKFGSSHLLLAATNYTIRVSTSSSSQINLWSTATTNWSRYLRTTTTGAPAAGDDMIITGEWTAAATVTSRTVTMDSTAATDYGSNTTSQVTPAISICKNGTLTFGTTASTTYILQVSGYIVVYNGGTYSQGVSGTEIPRNSKATVQFDCVADGDFGLVARRASTVNMYGLSRTLGNNTVQTLLAANASAGATTLTTAVSTGWLNGDSVCYAPTNRTSTEFEKKALTADASGTTLTTTALTNARSGTSPTQAEVGLLTRNNVFTSVTQGTVTFFYVADTAIVNLSFTEFNSISNNNTGKRGIEVNTTTGTFNCDSCSVHDTDSCAFFLIGSALNGPSITNTVVYNTNVATSANGFLFINNGTSGTWTINNVMFCGTTSSGTTGVFLTDIGGVFTNVSISGCTAGSAALEFNETASATIGTFNNVAIHSNGAPGFLMNFAATGSLPNFQVWRNNSDATNLQTLVTPLSLVSWNCFGNNGGSYVLGGGNGLLTGNLTLDNCTSGGDTSFATASDLVVHPFVMGTIHCYSCAFSQVTGIKTKSTASIILSGSGTFGGNQGPTIYADNCILNGTSLFSFPASNTYPIGQIILAAQNFGQVANDNRTYVANGATTLSLIQTNTSTIFGSNIRSEQMSPATASFKLSSGSILVPCASGKAATPIVQVRKDGTYNGAAPRLILKRQDSMGVTSDTVLDTLSVAANTWEALTGTTGVAPQDGVYEFVIDCDGTAGSVFVGDATATTA